MRELGPTRGYEWHCGMSILPTDRQASKQAGELGRRGVLNEPGEGREGSERGSLAVEGIYSGRMD